MKEMYFAATECSKVTEETIAYHVSTIKPEIAMQWGLSGRMCSRFYVPTRRNPKGLVKVANLCEGDRVQRERFVENMCNALLPKDHCYDVNEMSEKLLKVLTAPAAAKDLRLVALTITDGRLRFSIWQAVGVGLVDVKVLPTELTGTDNFAFGIKASQRSRDEIWVRCVLDGSSQFRYTVEQYCRGKIVTVREISYRLLRNKDISKDEAPHFNGYMETLTVQ